MSAGSKGEIPSRLRIEYKQKDRAGVNRGYLLQLSASLLSHSHSSFLWLYSRITLYAKARERALQREVGEKNSILTDSPDCSGWTPQRKSTDDDGDDGSGNGVDGAVRNEGGEFAGNGGPEDGSGRAGVMLGATVELEEMRAAWARLDEILRIHGYLNAKDNPYPKWREWHYWQRKLVGWYFGHIPPIPTSIHPSLYI